MDLLGGYNSDSDSDESNPPVAAAPVAPKPTVPAKNVKLPPLTKKVESKADKKKRVMGKKLLKLSSVLPQHILNQLQQSGGGSSKAKSNHSDSDDVDSDSSSDEDDERPVSRKKKTSTKPATKDYSKDEGLMGLLSELSKSSSSNRKPSSTTILGNTDAFVPPPEVDEDSPTVPSSTEPEKPKPTSEPLGAAFLTTTVETVVRKGKESATVRNIHGDSTLSPAASVHIPESTVPRPSISSAVPKPRVQTASARRSAAPAVRMPSYSQNMYATQPPSATHYNSQPRNHLQQQQQKQQQQSKKKKPLSRKRQMEQMLRAGKLDQVQGDHQLEGGSHIYNMDQDGMAMPAAASLHQQDGVRVVPTGSYNPSLGSNSTSKDVTSRQKGTNQLNSLLANAASLQQERAQNPQYHLQMAAKAKGRRSTAKRRYGW